MNAIREFVEANRQTGTTTALVRAVRETHGYLIVSMAQIKFNLQKKYPDIKDRILSLSTFDGNSWKGLPKGPVFFDADCGWAIRSFDADGYRGATNVAFSDGYNESIKQHLKLIPELNRILEDGYGVNNKQINIKLTEEDVKDVNEINNTFFEGEASNSMIGRILLRKGIAFYKKLISQ